MTEVEIVTRGRMILKITSLLTLRDLKDYLTIGKGLVPRLGSLKPPQMSKPIVE